MNEIICPLCGKPNPPDREICQFCDAPLKTTGFLASPDDQDIFGQFPPPTSQGGEPSDQSAQPESTSSLEQAIPDWLKQTEANFLEGDEKESGDLTSDQVSEEIDTLLKQPFTPAEEEQPVIDDEWLASLLAEAGVGELAQEIQPEQTMGELPEEDESAKFAQVSAEPEESELPPPVELEKPEWLTNLEAASTIKLEGGMQPSEVKYLGEKKTGLEEGDTKAPEPPEVPEWVGKSSFAESPPAIEQPDAKESEPPLAPAEIPGWLEALRPAEEKAKPTGPVEDISAADIVTAGPLVGLRGVISAHPSAIQVRRPPTYSIKLRVTDEQRARVEMMQELLAEEQKPKPLPSKPIITYRHILRLVVAALLILPIIWMIVFRNDKSSIPQSGNIPGVIDFTQLVQRLPPGAPVLLAFDYEPGFSGELNVAISALLTQLFSKNAYLTLVTTTPSGPALAESFMNNTSAGGNVASAAYSNYTDLGYIPGSTMGLLGLASSPRSVLPYSLDGKNVWAVAPLNTVTTVADFDAVIVITNDPDIARAWIEQVGQKLQGQDKPLLIVTSTQAEPLIRPYYEASPAQVQGMVAGLAGGLAYGRAVGSQSQNGIGDAFSIAITVSVLIILVGSIISLVLMMAAANKPKED
ncbi:MAG TPA: hypothetical protein VF831_00175 [Anaerolineales bacterium]